MYGSSSVHTAYTNNYWDVPTVIFNTQAVDNCEQLAYAVKTRFDMSQFICKFSVHYLYCKLYIKVQVRIHKSSNLFLKSCSVFRNYFSRANELQETLARRKRNLCCLFQWLERERKIVSFCNQFFNLSIYITYWFIYHIWI